MLHRPIEITRVTGNLKCQMTFSVNASRYRKFEVALHFSGTRCAAQRSQIGNPGPSQRFRQMKGTANGRRKALRVRFPAHGFLAFPLRTFNWFFWKSDSLNTSRCEFGMI